MEGSSRKEFPEPVKIKKSSLVGQYAGASHVELDMECNEEDQSESNEAAPADELKLKVEMDSSETHVTEHTLTKDFDEEWLQCQENMPSPSQESSENIFHDEEEKTKSFVDHKGKSITVVQMVNKKKITVQVQVQENKKWKNRNKLFKKKPNQVQMQMIEHPLLPACHCNKRKCNENIPFESRVSIHEAFWAKTMNQRREWVNENLLVLKPKSRTTHPVSTLHNTRRKFFLPLESGKMEVCRKMFFATIGFKDETKFIQAPNLLNVRKVLSQTRTRKCIVYRNDVHDVQEYCKKFSNGTENAVQEDGGHQIMIPSGCSLRDMYNDFIQKKKCPMFGYHKFRLLLQMLWKGESIEDSQIIELREEQRFSKRDGNPVDKEEKEGTKKLEEMDFAERDDIECDDFDEDDMHKVCNINMKNPNVILKQPLFGILDKGKLNDSNQSVNKKSYNFRKTRVSNYFDDGILDEFDPIDKISKEDYPDNGCEKQKKTRKKNRKIIQQHALSRKKTGLNHPVLAHCKCTKKCFEKISERQRKVIHDDFWSVPTKKEKKKWISKYVVHCQRRTRLSNIKFPRKHLSKNYYFPDETGALTKICRKFFMKTLGYHSNMTLESIDAGDAIHQSTLSDDHSSNDGQTTSTTLDTTDKPCMKLSSETGHVETVDSSLISSSHLNDASNVETGTPKKGAFFTPDLEMAEIEKVQNHSLTQPRRPLSMRNRREIHPILDPCSCVKKCLEKIPQERREAIHDHYWSLVSYNKRKQWILEHLQRQRPRTRTVFGGPSRKQESRRFFLPTQDDIDVEVCRRFFLSTLGYKWDKMLVTICKTTPMGSKYVRIDQRGRRIPAHTLPANVVSCAKDYIECILKTLPSISRLVNKSRKKKGEPRVSIESAVTIKTLFADYKTKYPEHKISYGSFRRLHMGVRKGMGLDVKEPLSDEANDEDSFNNDEEDDDYICSDGSTPQLEDDCVYDSVVPLSPGMKNNDSTCNSNYNIDASKRNHLQLDAPSPLQSHVTNNHQEHFLNMKYSEHPSTSTHDNTNAPLVAQHNFPLLHIPSDNNAAFSKDPEHPVMGQLSKFMSTNDSSSQTMVHGHDPFFMGSSAPMPSNVVRYPNMPTDFIKHSHLSSHPHFFHNSPPVFPVAMKHSLPFDQNNISSLFSDPSRHHQGNPEHGNFSFNQNKITNNFVLPQSQLTPGHIAIPSSAHNDRFSDNHALSHICENPTISSIQNQSHDNFGIPSNDSLPYEDTSCNGSTTQDAYPNDRVLPIISHSQNAIQNSDMSSGFDKEANNAKIPICHLAPHSVPQSQNVRPKKSGGSKRKSRAKDPSQLKRSKVRKVRPVSTRNMKEYHPMLPPCKCPKKCYDKISENLREEIHETFWNLGSYNSRKQWIAERMKREDPKRRTNLHVEVSRKRETRRYHLPDESETLIEVCRSFFLGTLGMKWDKIIGTICNTMSREDSQICLDRRGKCIPAHKMDKSIVESVESYAKAILQDAKPDYLANYDSSMLDTFMPHGLTMKDLHHDYKDKHASHKISYETFRRMFRQIRRVVLDPNVVSETETKNVISCLSELDTCDEKPVNALTGLIDD